MDKQVSKKLDEILKNPEKLKSAWNGLRVLRAIKSLQEEGKSPITKEITKKYYAKEIKGLSKDKIDVIIKRKRSLISRKLTDLKKIDLVNVIANKSNMDGRSNYYGLTPISIEIVNNEKILQTISDSVRTTSNERAVELFPEKELDYKKRYHSERIRGLLSNIKDELEHSLERDLYPENLNTDIIKNRVSNFIFRDDPLYNDLMNHIYTFIKFETIDEMISEFSREVIQYFEIMTTLNEIIVRELKDHLDLSYDPTLQAINSFGSNLVDWVIKNLYFLNIDDKDLYRRYSQEYETRRDQIILNNENVKSVKISGDTMLILPLRKREQPVFDGLNKMMEQIEDTPIPEWYKKAQMKKNNYYIIRNKIFYFLNREIEIPIYPGDCRILSPG